MSAAGPSAILLLMSLLPAAPDEKGGCELPAQGLQGVTASLRVRVAERGPAPGIGEVKLHVYVSDGPGLEVEEPRIEDPAEEWKVTREPEAWQHQANRADWTQVLVLRQSHPGPAELPAIKLRVRTGPEAPWQTAEWSDILRNVQTPASIPAPPAAPIRPRWLYPSLLGGLAFVLGLAMFLYRRRGARPEPLRPEERALHALEQLEAAGRTDDADAAGYHALLADVMRQYLEERFGLQATRRTTSDLAAALEQLPELTGEQRTLLRSFLERCDLVKFARTAASPEECRETSALARAIVVQTTPAEDGNKQRSWVKLYRSGRQAKRQSTEKDGGGG